MLEPAAPKIPGGLGNLGKRFDVPMAIGKAG